MNLIRFHAGIFKANCYILWQGKEALVIDPGGSYDRIIAEVGAVGATITDVLLTHGHFDHAGAAAKLLRDGARVYIHEADYDKCMTDNNLSKQFAGIDFEKFTPTNTLKDGDVLNLCGFEVKVVHTPGHSAGSVCYFIEDCIFSGDTLFRGSIGRTDFYDGSLDALINSLSEKLYSLEKDYKVYPGHLEPTTLHRERDENNFRLWGK